MPKPSNYAALAHEARSKRFKFKLKRELGCICANCGSTEMVEYHHIVPLAFGGTNNLSNIAPLCYACHKAAHNSRHIQHFSDHSRSNDGRPSCCDDKTAFYALDLMLAGQIGNRKCKSLMNLSKRYEPRNTAAFKKWCDARGIREFKNTLDIAISNRKIKSCCQCDPNSMLSIGYVVYADGSEEDIYFNDTGMNDDVIYRLRGTDTEISWGEIKSSMREISA